MPSSKGRGKGKGSPQKQAAARRVHTRSSTKSKLEEDQYDTLAALSPPKPKSNPKKLTLPSRITTRPKKQDLPPVNLPGSKSGIVVSQVVTLKRKKQASSSEESSNDGNSTGEKNASTGNSKETKTCQPVILQETKARWSP